MSRGGKRKSKEKRENTLSGIVSLDRICVAARVLRRKGSDRDIDIERERRREGDRERKREKEREKKMMLPVEEAHVDIRSSISISISSIARIEMVVGGSRMDIPVESKDEV